MAQKNNPTFAQAKGAPAGFTIGLLAKHAITQHAYSSLSTSSAQAHTLDTSTGYVRVLALNYPVLVRFNATGDAAVSSSNFDDFIPAGEAREYALDDTVDLLSLLSVGTAANVYVVEY